jgi:hypothetical protein
MPTAPVRSSAPTSIRPGQRGRAGRPFFGLIDSVLVDPSGEFHFDGAISRAHAAAAWTWMVRDLAADRVDPEASGDSEVERDALKALLPELLGRARQAVEAAAASAEADRRLKVQLGSDEAVAALPRILHALKCWALLEKAQSFGRATNGMQEEQALATALQAMPLRETAICGLLMQAAVGQVSNPSRLVTAVIRITGSPTEGAIQRAGFAPLIDALLAHAQNQVPLLSQAGAFADIDLACRAIDRFHRLVRAVHGYVELSRLGRWARVVSQLTRAVSARIEPRLREVVPDMNLALRRREGMDRIDSDQMLAALNGVYVLATVRECRDSLALNALFEQAWAQAGQALEIHLERNLDFYRQDPANSMVGRRLDLAIKMAELRFNPDYAEVLRRAKEAAEKRSHPTA